MRQRSAAYVMPLLLVGWLGMDSAVGFLPGAHDTPARQLVDPGRPPYSSIGKLKGVVTCSAAVVIDPRIVMTAAHCVSTDQPLALLASVTFQPSYPADAEWIDGRVVRLGRDLSPREHTASDEAADWAIVVLDAAPPRSRPLALRVLKPSEFRSLQGQVALPSYSADVASGHLLSAVEHCSIREVQWGVLIHDCPCAYGSSGAPLVVASGDGHALVGINSAMLYSADGAARVLHAAVSVSSFETALREVLATLVENPASEQHTALKP